MLILTRRQGEALVITTQSGEEIKIALIEKSGNQVRMGIIANPSVTVDREEIHQRKLAER